MTTIYPLCFHPSLLPSEEMRRECGDGIYVSNSKFRNFMNTDDEQLVILQITANGRSVCAHICGVHDDGSEDTIYAPFWMCELVKFNSGETLVDIEQIHPSIGNRIRIQPYTSGYSKLQDPVSALRNGFENYACLSSGFDIPILVGGDKLIVSIIDTHNTGPICIRGLEIEVQIDTPLDSTDETVFPNSKRARIEDSGANMIVDNVVDSPSVDDFDSMLPTVSSPDLKPDRFPGRGRRLDGKDC